MSTLVLDAEALLAELSQGVARLLGADGRLVGIRSGGAWLAERLHADLKLEGEPGIVSSSLHRDDFGARGMSTGGGATKLPFAVDGAHIVLVDDVLYTGRTVRAVINELYDFGRPARVLLAVLVDRGGRELPIEPAFAAARVMLPAAQKLRLARDASGRLSFAVEDQA